jgi:DNA-binding protein HU-beta
MKKSELIDILAEVACLNKTDVKRILDALPSLMTDEMHENGEFTLPGVGVFKVKERAARKGRNPQTGAPIDISASKSIGFKSAKPLKDAVNV